MKNIRLNFPFFTHNPHIAYLDSAATSQKLECAIKAINHFYTHTCSNIQRGLYSLAETTTSAYETARKTVAQFINAEHASEIVFTKGTTEGINFIAEAWAKNNLKPGDEIIITDAEHHANFLPWQRICIQTGAVIKFLPLNPSTYTVNIEQLSISEKTKLLAITLDSNVISGIWGDDNHILYSLIDTVKKNNCAIFIDAAQAIAHQQVNVQQLQADFLVFSGHKIFAPSGIGVLFIKKSIAHKLEPFLVGGGMVHSATKNRTSWASAPHKFEAGTPPIEQALGLEAALIFFKKNLNYQEISAHETILCDLFIAEVKKQIPEAHLIITPTQKKHLISFFIPNIHAHDIADFLGKNNIATRAGNICAQPLIESLNVPPLVRISVSVYTSHEDIIQCINAIKSAACLLSSERKK